jgi:hypothetical protein
LERIQSGKEMLVRIVAMLTKLVVRFDPEQYRVRESASGLAAPFDEDDDEHEDESKKGNILTNCSTEGSQILTASTDTDF